MSNAHYNVMLPASLDAELVNLAEILGTSKADVFRKAIMLLKYAVDADEIKFINNGFEKKVLVK